MSQYSDIGFIDLAYTNINDESAEMFGIRRRRKFVMKASFTYGRQMNPISFKKS